MIEALHHDEPVPTELDWDTPTDMLGIRNLMVMAARAERQRDQKRQLRDEISHLYQVEIDRLQERIDRIREHIRVGLMTVTEDGTARFPDVGTAYLRKVAGKVVVEDKGMFAQFASEMGCVRQVEEVDMVEAKRRAFEEITQRGVVVPGVRFVPEHQDITIRST